MQTPKSRSGSSEIPQKMSPATPRSTRVSRTSDNDSNSVTSATPTRVSIERSPKAIERRSPRSHVPEKRRPGRVSELEAQICQLKEDLKKTMDQLSSSETLTRRSQHEAEETKKQLQAMSAKLEGSQHQLVELSLAEEARLKELSKISQERDHAWQSEIEALQKQHSVDSAALSSAMSETQRLKEQLEIILKSEASHLKQLESTKTELQDLKQNLAETLAMIENLKVELKNTRKAEAEAHAVVSETQKQLDVAKAAIETLSSEGKQLREWLNTAMSELDESRAKVGTMEEIIKTLNGTKLSKEIENHDYLKTTGTSSLEIEQLESAIEVAETKYWEEQIENTMKMQSAIELVEHVKNESESKESELELALKNANLEIMQLKMNLIDKGAELQQLSTMNKEPSNGGGKDHGNEMQSELEAKLKKSINDIAELKANLMDKETELQGVLEENEMLKSEMGKKELENRKSYEATVAELELAKAKEQDIMLRLGYVMEESDKNSRRAASVAEQLGAAHAVNLEMEAELNRLRIQSDQWRKAAEAAAAVLTTERLMERTGSLDSDYNSIAGKLMSSPFSDDLEEESPKKKNNNVLKKIGGLWKKSPK